MFQNNPLGAHAEQPHYAPSSPPADDASSPPPADAHRPPSAMPAPLPVAAGNDDCLEIYMREILLIPRLSPEDEKYIIQRALEGDAKAREQLICANLRLVVKIANSYRHFGLPLLELISEGNIGLMKAVDRFSPERGAKLSTYAVWWIKARIRSAIASQRQTIRVPRRLLPKIARIRQVAHALQHELRREPTNEEIACEMQLPAYEISHAKSVFSNFLSLDAPLPCESTFGEMTYGEILSDDNAKTPIEHLCELSNIVSLHEAMRTLEPREFRIILMRFGFITANEMTLHEIGKSINMSRERVRQLQNSAFSKIRKSLEQQDNSRSRSEIIEEQLWRERMQKFRAFLAATARKTSKQRARS